MKQTIIIHGAPYEKEYYKPEKPSASNGCWLPWLQKQVAMKNELCQALEFPRPYDPIYQDWVEVFEQMKINSDTVLVGHSCGGGFLLRYLSEHPEINPGKVILVAPWIDPGKELSTDFFNFEFDPKLTERTPLHMMMSSDDTEQLPSFAIIREKLPGAIYHEFTDRRHFTEKEIPDILPILEI